MQIVKNTTILFDPLWNSLYYWTMKEVRPSLLL